MKDLIIQECLTNSKFILSSLFALSIAKAIEPLPKWVSRILKFGLHNYKLTNHINQ